jgi:hypothetical protein
MSVTFSTHLFGSVSGYSTLSKSPDISDYEDEALSGLGFGQTSDETFMGSLASTPSAYGRMLPSGRYAITRCFEGSVDDVGRTTILLASVVMSMQDWANHVRGNLKAFLLDAKVWNLSAFRAGESVQSKSYGGQVKPTLTDYYLVDYLVRIANTAQNPVVILPDGQHSADAIMHLAGVISPEDCSDYRWGIRMLSTTVSVDMMTMAVDPSSGGRRRIIQCDIQHEFYYPAVKFFSSTKLGGTFLQPLEYLSSDTFTEDVKVPSKIFSSKKKIFLSVGALAFFAVLFVAIVALLLVNIGGGEGAPEEPNGVPTQQEPENNGTGKLDPNAEVVDNCPDNPDKMEPGECGCDKSDVDRDNDGVPDCIDGCPDNPDKTEPGDCGCDKFDTDSDRDGVPDCIDGCPFDATKIEEDECGCNSKETDSDDDGVPDCNDACPEDPDKTEPDECGCGIPDTDTDADGTPDCIDNCPEDPDKTEPDECGCGKPDIDSDGDKVPDCIDNCPEDPDKTEPDECGCGIPDTDTDADGIPDCIDNCPEDPDKTEPDECGCGIPDTDTDADGIPDCLDEDDDNDFFPDVKDLDPLVAYVSEEKLCGEILAIYKKDLNVALPNCLQNIEELKDKFIAYKHALRQGVGMTTARGELKKTKIACENTIKKFLNKSNELRKKLNNKSVNGYLQVDDFSDKDIQLLLTLLEHIERKYEDNNLLLKDYYNELYQFRRWAKRKAKNSAFNLTDEWIEDLYRMDGVIITEEFVDGHYENLYESTQLEQFLSDNSSYLSDRLPQE